MNDEQVLRGYFFHSRYITRAVYQKYGLDTMMYKVTPSKKELHLLKTRLIELLKDQEFKDVGGKEDLVILLGKEFEWVENLNVTT